MKVYIDAGNTRIKWRLASGREGFVMSDSAAELERVFVECAPHVQAVYVCSVLGDSFAQVLTELAGRVWGVSPRFAVVESDVLGVVPAYSNLKALGVDRWLGLLVARARRNGECSVVLGAGSALTVDLLNADGRHLGGWIAPGYASVAKALGAKVEFARSESYLNELNSGGALTPPQTAGFGCSTVQCVNGGLDAMMRGFWQQVVTEVGASFGDESPGFFIAGGDAARVEAMLNKIDESLLLLQSPSIVLDGLVLWSEWLAQQGRF